jgi:hypothetical protein
MSRSGILVAWNAGSAEAQMPKPGDLLSIDIELPANHSFGRRCMHCQSVVARVTPGAQGAALVALQVNQMQFRSYTNGKYGSKVSPAEVRCSVM